MSPLYTRQEFLTCPDGAKTTPDARACSYDAAEDAGEQHHLRGRPEHPRRVFCTAICERSMPEPFTRLAITLDVQNLHAWPDQDRAVRGDGLDELLSQHDGAAPRGAQPMLGMHAEVFGMPEPHRELLRSPCLR